MWRKWHIQTNCTAFKTCQNTFKHAGFKIIKNYLYRICLPMQETGARSLFQEDPTCHKATKPVHLGCWAWEPKVLSPCATWLQSMCSRARALQREKPLQWEALALQQRAASAHSSEDPAQPKTGKVLHAPSVVIATMQEIGPSFYVSVMGWTVLPSINSYV